MDKSKLEKSKQHGEEHPLAKLKDQEVLEIVQAIKDGYTMASIGRAFNVTTSNIQAIKRGYTWSWLTGIGKS